MGNSYSRRKETFGNIGSGREFPFDSPKPLKQYYTYFDTPQKFLKRDTPAYNPRPVPSGFNIDKYAYSSSPRVVSDYHIWDGVKGKVSSQPWADKVNTKAFEEF